MDALGPSPVFGTGMNPLPPEQEPIGARRRPKLLITSLLVACGLLLTATATLTIMLFAAQGEARMSAGKNLATEFELKTAQKRLTEVQAQLKQAQDEASSARRELMELRMRQLGNIGCQNAATGVRLAALGRDKAELDAALQQLAERCKF